MSIEKEEVVFGVLNEDTGVFSRWSIDDRKNLAGTIVRIIDAIKKSEIEVERKTMSDEISAKLEIVKEIGIFQGKLKEIPFYKFSARTDIRLKILELQSELQYGRHLSKNVANGGYYLHEYFEKGIEDEKDTNVPTENV